MTGIKPDTKPVRNDVVYHQDLPRIILSKKIISPSGMELESTYIEVKAETIEKTEQTFNRIKNGVEE